LEVANVDRLFASEKADQASLILARWKQDTPGLANAGLGDVLDLESSSS
jgi:hypothetical protein